MATKSKRRPTRPRPVQYPKRRTEPKRASVRWALAAGAAALFAAAAGFAVLRGGEEAPARSVGLPNTSDYHSLLVSPSDPRALVLGTHQGLYRSSDGGRTWNFAELSGQDAMNLAQPSATTVWAAGHNVLARSTDGGQTWSDVRPEGLPGLDVHGFAVHPRKPRLLYAAIAGTGLYRSSDGGGSFSLVSPSVGPAVMALAITPQGRILAGDMQQGLLMSTDEGRSWRQTLAEPVMGIALNPENAKMGLATGSGIFRSTTGGESWKQVLRLPEGGGPVTWAPSDPSIAYVVGFDRTLYRTIDGGRMWRPVV